MQAWSAQSSSFSYSAWLADSVWREHRDEDEGSAGVRESRNPVRPSNTSGAALDLPPVTDEPPEVIYTL